LPPQIGATVVGGGIATISGRLLVSLDDGGGPVN